MTRLVFLFTILCALSFPAAAQNKAAGKDKSEVVAVTEERADLPRVLIIGDSVCQGYTPFLGDLLKEKATLYRTRKSGGSTVRGVEKMDEWLAGKKWDVIHFNWGIDDQIADASGKLQAPPEVYEKNLVILVGKLKATGAKLIWASTTPIPKGFGDVPRYNAIAARVMKEQGVAVDDLFAAMEPHVAEYQLPQDVHYNPEGYRFLAGQAAARIQEALDAR